MPMFREVFDVILGNLGKDFKVCKELDYTKPGIVSLEVVITTPNKVRFKCQNKITLTGLETYPELAVDNLHRMALEDLIKSTLVYGKEDFNKQTNPASRPIGSDSVPGR